MLQGQAVDNGTEVSGEKMLGISALANTNAGNYYCTHRLQCWRLLLWLLTPKMGGFIASTGIDGAYFVFTFFFSAPHSLFCLEHAKGKSPTIQVKHHEMIPTLLTTPIYCQGAVSCIHHIFVKGVLPNYLTTMSSVHRVN